MSHHVTRVAQRAKMLCPCDVQIIRLSIHHRRSEFIADRIQTGSVRECRAQVRTIQPSETRKIDDSKIDKPQSTRPWEPSAGRVPEGPVV